MATRAQTMSAVQVPGSERPGGWAPPPEARSWWEALASDSAVGVQVVNAATTRIEYVNDLFSRCFGLSSTQVVGGRIADFLPPEAARERIEIVRLAQRSQRPVVVNDMWNGVALRIVARPIYAPGRGPEEVLVTLRQMNGLAGAPLPPEALVVTPRHVDRGILASLSPREVEVLSMLAQGLTGPQIAGRLERSIKTIHRHRESIGRKLNVRTRLELIRLARLAGLPSDEASRAGAPTREATARAG